MAPSNGGGKVIDMTPCCPLDDCPLERPDTAPRHLGYVGRHRAPGAAVPAAAGSLTDQTADSSEPDISP